MTRILTLTAAALAILLLWSSCDKEDSGKVAPKEQEQQPDTTPGTTNGKDNGKDSGTTSGTTSGKELTLSIYPSGYSYAIVPNDIKDTKNLNITLNQGNVEVLPKERNIFVVLPASLQSIAVKDWSALTPQKGTLNLKFICLGSTPPTFDAANTPSNVQIDVYPPKSALEEYKKVFTGDLERFITEDTGDTEIVRYHENGIAYSSLEGLGGEELWAELILPESGSDVAPHSKTTRMNRSLLLIHAPTNLTIPKDTRELECFEILTEADHYPSQIDITSNTTEYQVYKGNQIYNSTQEKLISLTKKSTQLELSPTCKEIGYHALNFFTGTTLEIPEGVQTLWAIHNMPNLETIVLPKSLTKIEGDMDLNGKLKTFEFKSPTIPTYLQQLVESVCQKFPLHRVGRSRPIFIVPKGQKAAYEAKIENYDRTNHYYDDRDLDYTLKEKE